MKVSELIIALEKCDKDCEVFFDETQTKIEDGIEMGVVSLVNSVYECRTRKNDTEPWKADRIVLSNESEDKTEKGDI